MSTKIRLRRMGKKKSAFYRIVVTDSRKARDARAIEEVGTYNPVARPAVVTVKEDRIFHWMEHGAKPTESVEQVFKTAGVLDRWERYKKGEDNEILMKEAAEAEAGRNTSVKTRHD